MFSVRGRGTARRLAAATLVSGLVATGAIALAGPAAADDAPGANGGATATLGQLKVADTVTYVKKVDGQDVVRETGAGLFEMKVENGGKLQTYCIDFWTGAHETFKYKEVGWDQSSLHNNADAGKILWILENSYPKISITGLAEKTGVEGLTEKTAAAATQAAIWHFSDKIDATPKDEQGKKLTAYLLEKATKVEEPKASLSLSPSSVSGKAGDRIGPIKVGTNASSAVLSMVPGAPAGVSLVDKTGKAVTNAKDGDEVYVDVPAGTADGTAGVKAEATTKVPLGRAFVSAEDPSQTMILADSSDSTIAAGATVSWAKKGAVPAVTVAKDCAKGGLEIIASNAGDEPWTFDLKGTSYTIAPAEKKTITVPLAEDEAYKFTITDPNKFSETFEGVLDCKTAPGPQPSETPSTSPSVEPSPSTPGTTGDTTGGTTGGGDLAETGSSNATPMIAGIAAALVAIGGGAVFFLRKKKTAGQ
ncbi:thioester domain-containing protein [Streptomyces sp. SS]|uniref:thioester domain-containing protein n=1 Tax=Streptomyces sp. SS TaxID=260742 RepID=UPI000302B699|nr:thioester domain-containing protein [Streptomyces sp. SS]